jgi:hypothetical protein
MPQNSTDDPLSDLISSTLLFKGLEKKTEFRELGVVDGVILEGTKAFVRLGEKHFLYGSKVYHNKNLPLGGRVDLDKTNYVSLCNAMDWHLGNMALKNRPPLTGPAFKIVHSTVKAEDKSAVLISNSEECSDVEWA